MQGSPQSNSPLWNESDSIRETTLHLLDDPEDREAVRRAGQVLYDLAVVVTHENGGVPGDPSVTRAELRAIAADLRHTGGYCAMVRRSFDESSLDELDGALAKFAGRLGGRLNALVKSIEERLALDLERRGP